MNDLEKLDLAEYIEKHLGIDAGYVKEIAKRNDMYIRFTIPKQNKRERIVYQPSKELKVLQRWIVSNILKPFPVSEFSRAYARGDSIQKNAIDHRHSKYILHMDIHEFFPSITDTMMKQYLKNHEDIVDSIGLTGEDIQLLIELCFYRGKKLVIGSPASPTISNIIMFDFDNELVDSLKQFGKFIYTRYADDIYISSKNYIDPKVTDCVGGVLSKYGFSVNRTKTDFMNKSNRRLITGIVCDNNDDSLSVGNRKIKEYKRKLYNYLIKGTGNEGYLHGYLSFVKSVNMKQFESIVTTYQKYDTKGFFRNTEA